jgi:hypothetical protein
VNRSDLAHQVSLTLGDSAESFDIEAIVDDLIAAHDGDLNSIDDFDSQSYWAIVETHDTGAKAEAQAVRAHAEYMEAEAQYKAATTARQLVFARTVDAMGRGGNAILSRKIGLSAPTVKGIADRGRALQDDPWSPEWAAQFPYIRPECKDGTCQHASGRCERMRSAECRTGACDHASIGLYCAQLPQVPGRPAPGWEL